MADTAIARLFTHGRSQAVRLPTPAGEEFFG